MNRDVLAHRDGVDDASPAARKPTVAEFFDDHEFLALIAQNPTATFIVLCVNAFMWTLMLQTIRREIAAAKFSIAKPTNQRSRMK